MRNSLPAVLAMLMSISMAKAEGPSVLLALPSRTDLSSKSIQNPSEPQTLTIPAQTEVAVQLLSGIHTQVSHRGDVIKARLIQPVYVKGLVALPTGSWLDGRITQIQPTKHLNRGAELWLRFDRVTLPDGQAEPILGVLSGLDMASPLEAHLDREGYLKGTSARGWKKVGGGLFALGAFGGVEATLAGSALLGPILPVSGAALLGYEFLWLRGNDVHVPPLTRCHIRLAYPVTVLVQW